MKKLYPKIIGGILGIMLLFVIVSFHFALNCTLIFNRIAYGLLFLTIFAEGVLLSLLIYFFQKRRFFLVFWGSLIALLPALILINYWFPKSGTTITKEAVIEKEYFGRGLNHINVRLADSDVHIQHINKYTSEEWGIGTVVMVPITEGCLGWYFYEDDVKVLRR